MGDQRMSRNVLQVKKGRTQIWASFLILLFSQSLFAAGQHLTSEYFWQPDDDQNAVEAGFTGSYRSWERTTKVGILSVIDETGATYSGAVSFIRGFSQSICIGAIGQYSYYPAHLTQATLGVVNSDTTFTAQGFENIVLFGKTRWWIGSGTLYASVVGNISIDRSRIDSSANTTNRFTGGGGVLLRLGVEFPILRDTLLGLDLSSDVYKGDRLQENQFGGTSTFSKGLEREIAVYGEQLFSSFSAGIALGYHLFDTYFKSDPFSGGVPADQNTAYNQIRFKIYSSIDLASGFQLIPTFYYYSVVSNTYQATTANLMYDVGGSATLRFLF